MSRIGMVLMAAAAAALSVVALAAAIVAGPLQVFVQGLRARAQAPAL